MASGKERATSRPPAGSTATGSGIAGKDYKDSFIPRFENSTTSYPEWRTRVKLYARKMEIQGRKAEVALNILSVLEGPSWTQCEDLDLNELEKEGGLEILLKRLDKQWAHDAKVETPTHFDNFFFKMRRKQDHSILEYVTEFHQTLRQISKHKIDLPEEITGWMLVKRAGLTREQEQLIQTHVGSSLTLPSVEQALYLIIGQDHRHVHVPAHLRKPQMAGRWKRQGQAFWEDDYEAEENYDDEDAFYQDAQEYDIEIQQDYEPDETYYHDEPDEMESMFDTQEFDEVYSTYVDAKNRLNQLRQSRGFYPVVAVMDGNKGQAHKLPSRVSRKVLESQSLHPRVQRARPLRPGKAPAASQELVPQWFVFDVASPVTLLQTARLLRAPDLPHRRKGQLRMMRWFTWHFT